MKALLTFCQFFVGLVFIFSAFVKGVDTLGTAYRLEDYFLAFHTPWAIPYALFLSHFQCVIEFLVGILLVFNIKTKITSWVLLLMMLFFTGLTLNDAINNPVPDCGCFGDAIKLTNWQTFYKNVILMVPTLLIFIYRKRQTPWFHPFFELVIVAVATIGFTSFTVYNYRNLPCMDFMPWKVGTRIMDKEDKPVLIYTTYQNKHTGEKKEYLISALPHTDSAWVADWKYLSNRIVDENRPAVAGFGISDIENGGDMTKSIIKNPEFNFMVAAYNLDKTEQSQFAKIKQLHDKALTKGYTLIVLTATPKDKIEAFKKANHLEDIMFYNTDDVALKAMVRANPGLVLMKDAVVIMKWHWRNIPDFEKMNFAEMEKHALDVNKKLEGKKK